MPSEKKKFTLQSCTSGLNKLLPLPNGEERATTTLFLPPYLFEAKKYLSSIRQARQTGKQVFFHSEMDLLMKQSQQSGQNRNITLSHL